jgi:hypothetical protein
MYFVRGRHSVYKYYLHEILLQRLIILPIQRGQLNRYSDGLDGRGSVPGKVKIFLFSTAPTAALGPTKPTVQCVQSLFPREESGRSVNLTTSV